MTVHSCVTVYESTGSTTQETSALAAPYPEIKVWSSLFHKTDDEVDDEAAA